MGRPRKRLRRVDKNEGCSRGVRLEISTSVMGNDCEQEFKESLASWVFFLLAYG